MRFFSSICPDEPGGLSVGVRDLDRRGIRRPALMPRFDDQRVTTEERFDVADELHPACGEDHEVIADSLDVRDHVRGQHDRRAVLRDRGHELLQELASRERVEVRDWLVQQYEIRSLAEDQCECDLRPLAAGERSDLAGERDADLGKARSRAGLVPRRVEPPTELERVGHGEAVEEGAVLPEESDVREDAQGPWLARCRRRRLSRWSVRAGRPRGA